MDISFYKTYFEAEKNHWWFKARRNIFLSLLEKYNVSKQSKIFDFGCGSGFNVGFFQERGYNVSGSDLSSEAIEFGKSKGINNLTVNHLGDEIDFPENSFDLVMALDVIEHIEDDRRVIKSIEKVLNKGGMAIITVPAYRWLWGVQDDVARHFRRYTVKSLSEVVNVSNNLEIIKKSYFNTFLFPAIATVRLLSKVFKLKERESDFDINNKVLNSIFYSIFNLERGFLKHFNFPFGVSILMILKKK